MSEASETPNEARAGFRDYGASAPDPVRETYRANHVGQTLAFVRAKEREYLGSTASA